MLYSSDGLCPRFFFLSFYLSTRNIAGNTIRLPRDVLFSSRIGFQTFENYNKKYDQMHIKSYRNFTRVQIQLLLRLKILVKNTSV